MVQEEWGKLPYELSGTRDVLTFDNQGIGGSVDEADDEFTLEIWCDDIVDLAEQAFGAGVIFSVMGFSMGAFVSPTDTFLQYRSCSLLLFLAFSERFLPVSVPEKYVHRMQAAQHLAATRPDRVESVVLIGGASPGTQTQHTSLGVLCGAGVLTLSSGWRRAGRARHRRGGCGQVLRSRVQDVGDGQQQPRGQRRAAAVFPHGGGDRPRDGGRLVCGGQAEHEVCAAVGDDQEAAPHPRQRRRAAERNHAANPGHVRRGGPHRAGWEWPASDGAADARGAEGARGHAGASAHVLGDLSAATAAQVPGTRHGDGDTHRIAAHSELSGRRLRQAVGCVAASLLCQSHILFVASCGFRARRAKFCDVGEVRDTLRHDLSTYPPGGFVASEIQRFWAKEARVARAPEA